MLNWKYVFLLSCLACSSISYAEQEKFAVGAGVGSLYGNTLGVNANYRVMDHLDLTAALGVSQGSAIGLQYHLLDNNGFFQPRVSVTYGVNGHLQSHDESSQQEDTEREYFNGISIGGGTRLAFGGSRKHGVNLDILYRVYDGGLQDREQELKGKGLLDEYEFSDSGPGGVLAAFFGYHSIQFSAGWNYKF